LAATTGPASGRTPDPAGGPPLEIRSSPVQVSLTTVTDAVIAPVAGITAPGRDGDLFVVDQVGLLWDVNVSDPSRWPVHDAPPVVLDVKKLVVGPSRDGDERGFLGAAFSPDGKYLYTYTSEAVDPLHPADFPVPTSTATCAKVLPPDHQSVIREWQVTGAGTSAMSIDGSSSRRVLAFEQPQFNHNGGDLDFGPDGMLYITSGDGGGKDDQDCQTDFDDNPMFGHPEMGNGQSLTTVLGKILRIDPRGGNAANHEYGIPGENPFAKQTGALGEIYAFGLRNPFRESFDLGPDLKGKDLWVGDVGQNDIEEVDRVTLGANYGWRVREGAFGFDKAGFDSKGFESDASVFPTDKRAGLTDPVANYDHGDGTAVIGGNVYRGSTMPALVGTYVFGDTSRRLNNRHGRIFGIPSSATPEAPATISELRDGPIDGQVTGFGEDSQRELYALIFKRDGTGGAVLRLGQATP
jgi:hypothetical protein